MINCSPLILQGDYDDHSIYIKAFSDVTVFYPTVSIDVLNATNNETAFLELKIVFE